MKICIVNFSGRLNGNCHEISNFISNNLPEGSEIFLFEMGNLELNPCGDCNYECFKNRESCPHFNDDICNIYEVLAICEFAYFIVPNYYDFPCSNFFIFSERRQSFFTGASNISKHYSNMEKKFIVVSNTETMTFREVFRSLDEYLEEPFVLFLRTKEYEDYTENNLINIEEVQEELIKYINFIAD